LDPHSFARFEEYLSEPLEGGISFNPSNSVARVLAIVREAMRIASTYDRLKHIVQCLLEVFNEMPVLVCFNPRLWPSNVMMIWGQDGDGQHLSQSHNVIGETFSHRRGALFPLLRGARALGGNRLWQLST
jgi:hypothetical protein